MGDQRPELPPWNLPEWQRDRGSFCGPLTIFAWDANGAPASNVTFDWRCRVVSNQIIL